MRTVIRHAIALLLFGFICKVAFEAQVYQDRNEVPKSLLLGSLRPEQAIPSAQFDSGKILAAIRKE